MRYVKFDGSTVGTAVLGCSSGLTIMNFLNLYYGPHTITETAGTGKGMVLNVIQKMHGGC